MSKRTTYADAIEAGLVLRGDARELDLVRLPLGIPALDHAIGGGLPVGGITLISGLESTGKTILTQYAAAAQQSQKERRNVLYLDAERSYDRGWWKESGVDPELLYVARPMSGEQLINVTAAALVEDGELGMIILDSIAAVPPEAIVESDATQHTIGAQARLMSKFYAKILPLARGDVTIITTNQLRANMSRPGYTMPGGMSQKFYSHLILRTRRIGWIEERDERVGFQMEVNVEKNKTAPPQRSVTIPFRFIGQIDDLGTILDDAINAGIIEPHPPYYWVPDENGEVRKLLGKKNLREFYTERPALLDALKERLNG